MNERVSTELIIRQRVKAPYILLTQMYARTFFQITDKYFLYAYIGPIYEYLKFVPFNPS